jgi:hypothetical protein
MHVVSFDLGAWGVGVAENGPGMKAECFMFKLLLFRE